MVKYRHPSGNRGSKRRCIFSFVEAFVLHMPHKCINETKNATELGHLVRCIGGGRLNNLQVEVQNEGK